MEHTNLNDYQDFRSGTLTAVMWFLTEFFTSEIFLGRVVFLASRHNKSTKSLIMLEIVIAVQFRAIPITKKMNKTFHLLAIYSSYN